MSDRKINSLFFDGDYGAAAEKLLQGLEKEKDEGNDSLLYLMDLGLVLHTAKRFEESNNYFLRADKIAEIKDYTSLSTEAATLLTSDNIKQYKGEDFEKVLINTYLAINFTLMRDWEGAMVEARRVNHKLYLMVSEGKRKYKQNAFARYLMAILYELIGEYDDAYIDYVKTFELAPDFYELRKDLWRVAGLTKRREEQKRWSKELNLTDDEIEEAKKNFPKSEFGELIVFYENGIAPQKKPHPSFYSIPQFYPRYNPVLTASVLVNGEKKCQTNVLDNVEETAIKNLEEKYSAIIAKKIAGVVAKEVVAYQIGKAADSPLIQQVARLVFYASDQADLRSWVLLPKDLQVARLTLAPGDYKVSVVPEGDSEKTHEESIQIKKGKKVFLNYRYVPDF